MPFPNRTLAIMDNLEFVRSLDNECVDLIAMDPPFASNETFEGEPRPAITEAERGEERALATRHGGAALERYEGEDARLTRVRDGWSWRDLDAHWMADLDAATARAIRVVVDAVGLCATENEAAYVGMMAPRLWECRRVLKETGSIFVHCDWHANSYLRMLMDVIFGHKQLRNEVVWHYGKWSNAARNFQRNHDTILFYSKSDGYTFNTLYDISVDKRMKIDRGYQINSPGGVRQLIVYDRERAAGVIAAGNYDRLVDRSETEQGTPLHATWHDINIINSQSRERTGYATQKPLALYRRIVKASSNPDDVVLDLFAGCATTAIAAELEGRRWLACDMAYRASTMMMRRFYQNGIVLSNMNVDIVREAIGPHTGNLEYKSGQTIGPPDLAGFPRDDAQRR